MSFVVDNGRCWIVVTSEWSKEEKGWTDVEYPVIGWTDRGVWKEEADGKSFRDEDDRAIRAIYVDGGFTKESSTSDAEIDAGCGQALRWVTPAMWELVAAKAGYRGEKPSD